MNLVEGGGELGDEAGKIDAERLTAPDQYVVMSVFKATGASLGSGTQPSPDAISLGRVALLLGHGEAKAGFIVIARHALQRKRRAPDAIASGGPDEFSTFPEAPHSSLPHCGGDHRPMP